MAGPRVLAKCCNTIIQSQHRYDLQRCVCGKCFVDGGNHYLRMGFPEGNSDDWLEVLDRNETIAAVRTQQSGDNSQRSRY